MRIKVVFALAMIASLARAQGQLPTIVDPQSFMDDLLRGAQQQNAVRQRNEMMRLELERRDLERRLQFQAIERAEQQRWNAEDGARMGRDPGAPRGSGRRTPQQMEQDKNRRVNEVVTALRRYCPSGEPPCSPEPPQYLLDQAVALGLIEFTRSERSGRPTVDCFGMIDPGGATSFQCQ